MQDTIQGTTLPVLEILLDRGESVISEAGEFSWMSDAVALTTSTTGGGVSQGGLMGAFKRVVAGGSLLFNTYTAQGGAGLVAFASKLPGHIIPIEVGAGKEFLCHRHGFLAGVPGITMSVALQQSFSGGIFGGEGFILQRIGGEGKAWIELAGETISYDLAPGQTMRAHPGHVGLFEATVSFQVQRVPGLANRYLGGDGHHFVLLTGPGRIYLQSMPLAILAGALQPFLGKDERHAAVEGGMVGGVLGGLFDR